MRSVLAAVVVFGLAPSLAVAGPISAGVTLGVDQSKESGLAGEDASKTYGLFGRIGLTPRLSAQLELSKIQLPDQSTDIRSVTGVLVVDLTSSKTLVPVLLVGLGADRASTSYYADCLDCYGGTSSESATRIEGGFGLEYRAAGGVTIGADLRMGGRSISAEKGTTPVPVDYGAKEPTTALYYGGMQAGEYRSARVTAAIRF